MTDAILGYALDEVSKQRILLAVKKHLGADERNALRDSGAILGLVDDLSRMVSDALKRFRNDKWVPEEVDRVLSEVRARAHAESEQLHKTYSDEFARLASSDPKWIRAEAVQRDIERLAIERDERGYVLHRDADTVKQAIRSIGLVWAAAFGLQSMGGQPSDTWNGQSPGIRPVLRRAD